VPHEYQTHDRGLGIELPHADKIARPALADNGNYEGQAQTQRCHPESQVRRQGSPRAPIIGRLIEVGPVTVSSGRTPATLPGAFPGA